MNDFNKQKNTKAYLKGDKMEQNSSSLEVREDVVQDLEKQNLNEHEASLTKSQTESLAANQLFLKLSQSLSYKLKKIANTEGISVEELAKELISEGITQRVISEGNSSSPNHCLTRTGYVPPEIGGYKAPQLSHHQDYNSQQQKRPNKWNNNNYRAGANRNSMTHKNYNNQQRISAVKTQRNGPKFSSSVNTLNRESSKESSNMSKQK